MAGFACFVFALVSTMVTLAVFMYMIRKSYYVHHTASEASEKTGRTKFNLNAISPN